jgi:hypothetical protein
MDEEITPGNVQPKQTPEDELRDATNVVKRAAALIGMNENEN